MGVLGHADQAQQSTWNAKAWELGPVRSYMRLMNGLCRTWIVSLKPWQVTSECHLR